MFQIGHGIALILGQGQQLARSECHGPTAAWVNHLHDVGRAVVDIDVGGSFARLHVVKRMKRDVDREAARYREMRHDVRGATINQLIVVEVLGRMRVYERDGALVTIGT